MDHSRDPQSGPRSALIATLRRWLRPPRKLRPTRAGWVFFALVFGVGFAALNTGNNLLYLVLSLMLSFLVLSGVLSESALRGIQVRRRLPRQIYAGASQAIGLEISNHQQRIPAFAIVVEDRVREGDSPERAAGRAFALRVGPTATERRAYRFRPRRRGEMNFTGFHVSTRFPFGLFSKSLELERPERSLAFPAIEPVRIPDAFGAARDTGENVSGGGSAGSEVSGLREYRTGDPTRRIHWRSSLRRRRLFVRELENEHESEVEVRLMTGNCRPGEPFERSVRWAASEVTALLDSGRRVALRTDAERLAAAAGVGQRLCLLAFLARVQPDGLASEESP